MYKTRFRIYVRAALCERRKGILPSNFEMLPLFYLNSALWSLEDVIKIVL